MSIKRTLSIILAVLFVTVGVMSQTVADKPVKWRMTVKMTSETEGVVTLRAIVGHGWHFYGTKLPDGGPVPTSFNFAGSKGLKFIDSTFVPSVKPVTKTDKTFGMSLEWWETNVNFTRRFKLDGNIKDAVVKGSVRYMCCDDKTCTPPATENFSTTVRPFVKK